eukprot:4947315-Amphidinium_carterae.1
MRKALLGSDVCHGKSLQMTMFRGAGPCLCQFVKHFFEGGLARCLLEHETWPVMIQFSLDSTTFSVLRRNASIRPGATGVVRWSGNRVGPMACVERA